jgi:hypothetical protein
MIPPIDAKRSIVPTLQEGNHTKKRRKKITASEKLCPTQLDFSRNKIKLNPSERPTIFCMHDNADAIDYVPERVHD